MRDPVAGRLESDECSGASVPLVWCSTSFCEIERKVVLRDDEASQVVLGWVLVSLVPLVLHVGPVGLRFSHVLRGFKGGRSEIEAKSK